MAPSQPQAGRQTWQRGHHFLLLSVPLLPAAHQTNPHPLECQGLHTAAPAYWLASAVCRWLPSCLRMEASSCAHAQLCCFAQQHGILSSQCINHGNQSTCGQEIQRASRQVHGLRRCR